jgi:hypothetical protein
MAKRTDWLKQNHTALYNQGSETKNYLDDANNRTRMGFLSGSPQGIWLEEVFSRDYAAFAAAYLAWLEPEAERTPAKALALRAAEKAFKKSYRKLYNGFLKENPLVTDGDLSGMALPVRPDGKRHPAPVPTTNPAAKADTSQRYRVTIDFYESDGTHRKAKPDGVHGAEIRWGVLDADPVDAELLPNSSFDTHTPFVLEFQGHDRGKMLYYSLRWENTTGEKGPFGPILNTVIP